MNNTEHAVKQAYILHAVTTVPGVIQAAGEGSEAVLRRITIPLCWRRASIWQLAVPNNTNGSRIISPVH